ncbi:hypothetical protein AFCDBAGC_4901 [Methylobacterium cerastii]|uniref:Uncharacterized protein n=1 Tax=Methylobacterium cerastii TaxID=932741 RepID=A0ABQ4QQM6_9HYPH|nr:hypothetical protein [Methylobacterium cerastii]GJD47016.1 hypothetical protein AFCDBAGC_4901 [Methylobacterium cerastii]
MTDDEQTDDWAPSIEQANGSFYDAYKQQLTNLIDSIEDAGSKALQNSSLSEADRWELEHGVRILHDDKSDLLKLLSKIIDETNPSFFQECTVASIMTVLSGVFMTSKYVRLTDSAVQETLKAQARIARGGRERQLSKDKIGRIEMVKRHAVAAGADLRFPYKAADAIRDAVNAERTLAGKPEVTLRTVQNWINEAALGISSEKS